MYVKSGMGNDLVNTVTAAVMTPTSPGVPAPPLVVDAPDVQSGLDAIAGKIGGAIDTLFSATPAAPTTTPTPTPSSAAPASTGMSRNTKIAIGVGAVLGAYLLLRKKRS